MRQGVGMGMAGRGEAMVRQSATGSGNSAAKVVTGSSGRQVAWRYDER